MGAEEQCEGESGRWMVGCWVAPLAARTSSLLQGRQLVARTLRGVQGFSRFAAFVIFKECISDLFELISEEEKAAALEACC